MRFLRNRRLIIKVLPLVLLAVIAKALAHTFHLEILTLSPLFSSVIGAAVFLLGFTIGGTLNDYKESERLPSDLAASLHSIADECDIVATGNGKRAAGACRQALAEVTMNVLHWFRNKAESGDILSSIKQLNARFTDMEPFTETTYINRLEGEQNQVRKMILRIQTIRDISFVGTGYAIVELSTLILIIGMIITKHQAYFESLFFIGFITFILTYMISLITDLDNPFDYTHQTEGNEVSLKPLEQFLKRVRSDSQHSSRANTARRD